jgi:hypothetical protein
MSSNSTELTASQGGGFHTASTHRSRRRICQRATGRPWNLTFAVVDEKVADGENVRSQMAINSLSKVPVGKLHPKAAYSHCRPLWLPLLLARGSLMERRHGPPRQALSLAETA